MVSSYSQLLAKRYEGQLDDRADRYIGYIVEGAGRMRALITDLLAYSRVGTKAKPFEEVDVGRVVDEALTDLALAIEERGAEVTRDQLPVVMADAVQLRQVFQNLIGNGLKFVRSGAPQVHVGAARRDDGWVFSVRDNGIGIDRKHVDRIFVIFQRLHERHEYPGSGIGLSIVKKIVERHQGRIWVDSVPGEGSTFWFYLPRDPRQASSGGGERRQPGAREDAPERALAAVDG